MWCDLEKIASLCLAEPEDTHAIISTSLARPDKLEWWLENKRVYTVRSTYRLWLMHGSSFLILVISRWKEIGEAYGACEFHQISNVLLKDYVMTAFLQVVVWIAFLYVLHVKSNVKIIINNLFLMCNKVVVGLGASEPLEQY